MLVRHDRTARRSPAWHRNARARRSRTRRRIHTARCRGAAPRPSDLLALQGHHSRPVFRELMGKSTWHKRGGGRGHQSESYAHNRDQPWHRDQYAGQGGGWQLWRGAWSPSRKEDFQRYDQVQLEGSQPSGSESSLMKGASGFMKAVQKSLTTAKRCETRIRKLQEERSTRDAKWHAWQAKMRAEYAKQKRLYEGDIARIDREVVPQKEQGEQAAQSMTELIAGGVSAMEVPMESTEETDDWEAFISQAATTDQMSDFMRQAMESAAALQQGNVGLHATRGGPPRLQKGLSMMPPRLMESMVGCPPRPADSGPERPPDQPVMMPQPMFLPTTMLGQTAETAPPPIATTAPPGVCTDPEKMYAAADAGLSRPGPYTRSPGGKSPIHGGKHPAQEASPGQGAVPPQRQPRDPLHKRPPVKALPIQVVHPTSSGGVDLATKLEQKRAAIPFQQEGQADATHPESHTAVSGGDGTHSILVDDDPSSLSGDLDE